MNLSFRPKLGLLILINYIILSTLFCNVQAACEDFPPDLKDFCLTMDSGKNNTRDPNLPQGGRDLPNDRQELRCVTLSCFCPALNGKKDGTVNGCTLPNGKKLKKCIRHELRMLSDEQRQAYFKTIKEMKANNDYLIVATLHKQAWDDGAAHNGPCFLPWHRELLKVFELMMREASYKILQSTDVCLPYWDSTLDGHLPTPKDSYLFTADFIGSTNDIGQVIDGPFSPWETLMNTEYIERDVGRHGACYQEERFTWQMQQTNIEDIIAYSQPQNRDNCSFKAQAGYPEYAHGGVHTFIGGYMSNPGTSANDPSFFNHHCFVDLLFEEWRQARQNYSKRPVEYPADISDCETEVNYKNKNMSQFPYIRNIDGCRNEYTDNMYEYAPRPNCSIYKPDCGSKYLFCDLSHGDPHCAAKARPGGDCTGFLKGEKVCYNSECVNNICVGQPTQPTSTTQPPSTVAPSTAVSSTAAPTIQAPSTEVSTTQTPSTAAPTTQAPSTAAPTTQPPSTAAPSTAVSSTAAPTIQPPSTASPTTYPPSTAVPSTAAPTTQPPSTAAPTTQPPSTAAPTTQPPSTAVPSTAAPTTQPPSTAAPTTQPPSTAAPTTQPPSTAAPTTQPPSTAAPTTQPPSTVAPTTQPPSTAAPTTQPPSTASPKTYSPSTAVPSTAAPTTYPPSTEVPSTATPTSQASSTAAPTTEAPCDDNEPYDCENCY